MILSDVSVTRPVLAAVLSLLLIAFGLVAFDRLPLREYSQRTAKAVPTIASPSASAAPQAMPPAAE